MTTSIPLLMKSVSTRFENYHNIIHANIWSVNGNLFWDAINITFREKRFQNVINLYDIWNDSLRIL